MSTTWLKKQSFNQLCQNYQIIQKTGFEVAIELRGIGEIVPCAKEIQSELLLRFPGQVPFSKTTICNILKAAELITRRRVRQRVAVCPKPSCKAETLNQFFSADYKGRFLTGSVNGVIRC